MSGGFPAVLPLPVLRRIQNRKLHFAYILALVSIVCFRSDYFSLRDLLSLRIPAAPSLGLVHQTWLLSTERENDDCSKPVLGSRTASPSLKKTKLTRVTQKRLVKFVDVYSGPEDQEPVGPYKHRTKKEKRLGLQASCENSSEFVDHAGPERRGISSRGVRTRLSRTWRSDDETFRSMLVKRILLSTRALNERIALLENETNINKDVIKNTRLACAVFKVIAKKEDRAAILQKNLQQFRAISQQAIDDCRRTLMVEVRHRRERYMLEAKDLQEAGEKKDSFRYKTKIWTWESSFKEVEETLDRLAKQLRTLAPPGFLTSYMQEKKTERREIILCNKFDDTGRTNTKQLCPSF